MSIGFCFARPPQLKKVRMRVRAATARMHEHTHVILAIALQRKGSQETTTRVVVLMFLLFRWGKQSNTRAQYRRGIYPGQFFGAGRGSPKKRRGKRLGAYSFLEDCLNLSRVIEIVGVRRDLAPGSRLSVQE